MSFKLTTALKRYAVRRLGVKRTADDGAFRNRIGSALKKGSLSADRMAALTAGAAKAALDGSDSASGSESQSASAPAGLSRRDTEALVQKHLRRAGRAAERKAKDMVAKATERLRRDKPDADRPTPAKLFGPADKHARVRLKSVAERFDASTKAAVCPKHTLTGRKHPHAGQPAEFGGATLMDPSRLAKAVAGAYIKWQLAMAHLPREIPRGLKMTEEDEQLIQYALHELEWTGEINPTVRGDKWGDGDYDTGHKVDRRKLTEVEIKADLLDDSTSGGIYAAPIVFDDMVVLTPVLYGELFPRVKVINIARGRRVEGYAMTNPTVSDGVNEGTAITPFDATAFIGAFNTTIYPAVGAMKIGLDLEEDAPADLGGLVAERFGLKFLEYLDMVVASGNGSSQPLGVLNTVGAVTVTSDNSTGGPPTVSDYESLMFGVQKKFRFEPGANFVFIGNETSYARARGIAVGPGDQRRVFLMDEGSYQLFGYPYAIQADIANSKVAAANLNRYRMYRRLGLQVRIETQGSTLALANEKLLVLRQRMGGQMEVAGAVSLMTDAKL